ncbi:sulfatase-like hydrolase/transferase [Paenibacillus alba]|uniref:sulfatase-like hydrolase/transferase n=1 Tax=Paenibacillus alba TaxID=1197127 RepID=UPI001565CD01|nr:sulfatase-like hydrolase/transferase [Paenibacillus alba]NQX68308.1 sulfatase-like hydrolase/transferase [Paenibacillus alba]
MSKKPIPQKPNILVILVDEERYPPPYESHDTEVWRKNNFVAHERLRSKGLEFHRHYIGSAACCPSRATLFTGQYPSLHGVSQTNGIAKDAFDSDMFWLNKNTVPTMGDYFQEAGYRTFYKGKWHISHEDIVTPGTHQSLTSYNPANGVPDARKSDLYIQANPLGDYGFSDWVGPEPHGKNPRNSASSASSGVSGRDVVYAEEVVELIESLDHRKQTHGDEQPWLIVSSFLNPHDIVLYGALTAHNPLFNFAVEPMPQVSPPPTQSEDLSSKPRCQASYRDTYPRALQPIWNHPHYRQLYYQLQKNADEQANKVLDSLMNSSFYEQTIVIFTSDHGDLLGSHGDLHQKWYCAYEEMLHVPLIIHNPHLFTQHENIDKLTSHVDLLPTLLGLAHADAGEIQNRLKQRFSEVRPLVGRDLSASILGFPDAFEPMDEPIYFMTDDDVTRGQHQVNPLGIPYSSVIQPNHIETILVYLTRHQNKELWKYTRYFDNPQFWSQPGKRDVILETVEGTDPAHCSMTVKAEPVPEEYELYNVTNDPLEVRNLAYPAFATEESRSIQQYMAMLLNEQRKRKRLVPTGV